MNHKKQVTATPDQHKAACAAWHANKKRKRGLSESHRLIIEAIDRGELKIINSHSRLSRLEDGISQRLA